MDMQAVKLHIDERIEAGLLPGRCAAYFWTGGRFYLCFGLCRRRKENTLEGKRRVSPCVDDQARYRGGGASLRGPRAFTYRRQGEPLSARLFAHEGGTNGKRPPDRSGGGVARNYAVRRADAQLGVGLGRGGRFSVRGAFPARYVGGGRRGLRGLASRFRPREQTVLQRGRRVRSRRRIVEIASGMPYAQFLEENIFRPLGMRDTGYTVDDERFARTVKMYRLKDDRVGNSTAGFQTVRFSRIQGRIYGRLRGAFFHFPRLFSLCPHACGGRRIRRRAYFIESGRRKNEKTRTVPFDGGDRRLFQLGLRGARP